MTDVVSDTNNSDTWHSMLLQGVCRVSFTKVNGDTRIMECTLNEEICRAQGVSDKEDGAGSEKVVRRDNPDVMPVWDVTARGWRSFRIENVTSIEAVV